jgi:predicted ATP-grasp superfamily ATP-dependent carboligase
MAKMIPAAERLQRARQLIQKARDHPVPVTGKFDLTYITEVKQIMQQARDLIKFIPYTPTASDEMKAEVEQIFAEIDRAKKEIFR